MEGECELDLLLQIMCSFPLFRVDLGNNCFSEGFRHFLKKVTNFWKIGDEIKNDEIKRDDFFGS